MMQRKRCSNFTISTSVVITILFLIASAFALPSKHNVQSHDGSSKFGRTKLQSSPEELCSSTSRRATKSTKTTGCGVGHSEGYSSDEDHHNLESGGIIRYYTIDVPLEYNRDRTRPWPLILDFHGASHTSVEQYNNSRYFAVAGSDKYIVVYPQGRGNVWEGASYSIDGVDDLRFVADLLDHLQSIYCIDSDRIYASGKSNGGGFVDMLACSEEGDNFAAFAMASAALYSDNSFEKTKFGNCSKSRAILESHGGKDKTTPYEGQPASKGNGGATPDIQKWLGWWALRDGCQEDQVPTSDDDREGYSITSYSCGGYYKVIQGYYISELDHCWPSADGKNLDASTRKKGCSFYGLNFTSVVLDWFGRWDKNSAPQN
jgi:poly(3-hydroxybutyrate) depolymerase